MTSKSIPPPPPLTSSTPPPIDFGDDVDEDEFEDDIYGDDQSYDHDPITTTTATIGIPTTFQIGDDEVPELGEYTPYVQTNATGGDGLPPATDTASQFDEQSIESRIEENVNEKEGVVNHRRQADSQDDAAKSGLSISDLLKAEQPSEVINESPPSLKLPNDFSPLEEDLHVLVSNTESIDEPATDMRPDSPQIEIDHNQCIDEHENDSTLIADEDEIEVGSNDQSSYQSSTGMEAVVDDDENAAEVHLSDITTTTTTTAEVPSSNVVDFAICDDREEVKEEDEEEEDISFDDFTDFASVPCDNNKLVVAADTESNIRPEEPVVEAFEADFNQFANFDSFSANMTTVAPEESSPTVGCNATTGDFDDADDFDDDDFGDFTSSAPVVVPSSTVAVSLLPEPNYLDILEVDVSGAEVVFKEMFPELVSAERETASVDGPAARQMAPLMTTLGFETTALTEDYQWLKSTSNTCLIKCLGIDSRNILHGTKWKSDMPRYAANLGFSPLQPMKSNQCASGQSATKPTATSTTDIPAVQFDWDSSGLIDPLNALQSHTLLLDLEQLLVVVANLENTKIASNTTSTPTTANADIIRIPLTGTPPPACDGDMAADDHTASTTTTTTETNHLTTNDSVQLLDDAFLAELDAMYSKFSPFKGIGFTELCDARRGEPNVAEIKAEGKPEVVLESSPDHVSENTSPAVVQNDIQEVLSMEEKVSDKDAISAQFPNPLRETHIFTPIKGVESVSREIDPGVETAVPVVPVKEYRDVEYDPVKFLDETLDEKNASQVLNPLQSSNLEESDNVASSCPDPDDEFCEFQSVPVREPMVSNNHSVANVKTNPLQLLSVNNLSASVRPANRLYQPPGPELLMPTVPTISHNTPASNVLIPQATAAAAAATNNYSHMRGNTCMDIRWPDNSDRDINKSELDRIDEIFSKKQSYWANTARTNEPVKKSPQKAAAVASTNEDDDWTDFMSVNVKADPVKSTKTTTTTTNNTSNDDDWTEFMSSNSGPNFTPWSGVPSQQQSSINTRPPLLLNGDGHGRGPPPPGLGTPMPDMKYVDPTPFFISTPSSHISPFGQMGRMNSKK